MSNKLPLLVVVLCAAVALQGCATGYNRTMITSTSNIGVDINTAPAKMETAISSTTGVITPTFEGGQTLPLISSLSGQGSGMAKFFKGLSSTVATGDAAYTMSYLYADCNRDIEPIGQFPEVELTQAPKAVPGPGQVKPAIFVTNTMVGAKLSWSRHAPLVLSSMKIGFNRQEEVSTPILVEPSAKRTDRYVAGVPSFLATIDHWVDLRDDPKNKADSQLKYLQYFATGEAANNLVLRSDVRRALFHRITPFMQDSFCEDDYETKVR